MKNDSMPLGTELKINPLDSFGNDIEQATIRMNKKNEIDGSRLVGVIVTPPLISGLIEVHGQP